MIIMQLLVTLLIYGTLALWAGTILYCLGAVIMNLIWKD